MCTQRRGAFLLSVMRTQNKAGISLPPDLADNFPTSLVSAIAHLQVAREMLDQQSVELQYLSAAMQERIRDQITELLGEITNIDDSCCEMLFDIFATTIDGLPLRKSLLL